MRYLLILVFFGAVSSAFSQTRVVAECTVTYAIKVNNEDAFDKDALALLKQSVKTVYIKGNHSRSDLISPSFSQSFIYNKASGDAAILREIGANKFLTKMNAVEWAKQNDKFSDLTIQYTPKSLQLMPVLLKTFKSFQFTPARLNAARSNQFTPVRLNTFKSLQLIPVLLNTPKSNQLTPV